MTQKPMYAAMVNSPVTEIVADISVTDTVIELLDATKLPTAPNLAVIGSDETAETVRYTEVNGNVITVERGFQGAAKSWSAGTKVARYFTAYDHDSARENIEGLYDRLDAAESKELTLQPGVQLVTAKRDARFKLGAIKGKTEINGQGRIGIIGVENPYVTRISGNLLPPFYEWSQSGNIRLDSPYDVTITAESTAQEFLQYDFVPMSNQTYTISGANIRVVDLTNVVILAFTGNTNSSQTFSVPASCKQLRIVASNATQATVGTGNIVTSPGTYRTQNPVLNFGDKSLPFVPREDAMLAFQTELHANPTDGSESDELFERDGQYFKLAKWKKRALDGSENWIHIGNKSGFKSLGVNSYALDAKKGDYEATLLATKFNGQKLKAGNSTDLSAEADIIYIYDGGLRVSIANTDSGWGDNYTPTSAEIKAYFMGWKMYTDGENALTSIYNGSGTKGWFKRNKTDTSDNSNYAHYNGFPLGTVPTKSYPDWTPYNLLYKLTSPTVESVTSEGCLALTEGDNQIEVGTGIILREGTQPKLSVLYNTYEINSVSTGNVALNPLRHKADKISAVYKNNHPDKWSRVSDTNSYGRERAFLDASLFDQTAPYSVTYIKLDKSPVVPITGSLALNEKARLTDLTAGIQEALQRVSVVEQKKAEKDQPVWIAPTLLNGWIPYVDGVNFVGYPTAQYMKDSQGFVHIRGLIKGGPASQSIIFQLPKEYRPKENVTFITNCYPSDIGLEQISRIKIEPTGNVIYMVGPAMTAAPSWVSLYLPAYSTE